MPERKGNQDQDQGSNEKSCFVIMPFGGHYDNYYIEVYCPAIRDAGLKPVRADNIFRPGVVIKDIWELTQAADIVLADLSGLNPNVFYELGLAHAIAKPVVLTSDQIETIPFDLKHLRVIEYDKNYADWGVKLRTAVESSISEILGNPKLSILTNFLRTSEVDSGSTSISEKALIAVAQRLDSLQRQIDRIKNDPSPSIHTNKGLGNLNWFDPISKSYFDFEKPASTEPIHPSDLVDIIDAVTRDTDRALKDGDRLKKDVDSILANQPNERKKENKN